MKLLLDTHTFLWWLSQPEMLSEAARAACYDRRNQLIISIASLWEIQIKMQAGKLKIDDTIPAIIERQRQYNELDILAITLPHVLALDRLPSFHKDPFDRMLVAQAMTENIAIITADQAFHHYPISTIW